ncbi:coenzyme F420 hydrogenase/dehydrogenase beta subunit domain protein [Syntrophobotulus glycolicus DSM 8271]|uniref:Coenzyme F420 hydrogenase/dehydrogenase beta subunit domain protein n=2 Tax=Syntrophobotulus TaxID=51196 RepID=F0SY71_SYNGF|nr:coenzyme F420 hydrogenase/dehydrogenase beta subunit domain protein [Syntrophobotulus glycolicus DSM 8271]
MILYNDKKECSGCAACLNICAKQAITMQPDEDGFIYPTVNDNLCIECGHCRTVCAFQIGVVTADVPLATYVAINKNQSVLAASSSGGAFAALASIIFEQNGVVFGCTYNSDMEPMHIGIDNLTDMKKLQGSKYVQSNINHTYLEAKKYLELGNRVLFTGAPCQIAGLKSYLRTDYENLITADIICHGVPSAEFFKGYIKHLEAKLKGKVIDFRFRDKEKGWGLMGKIIYIKNGVVLEQLIPPITSYYYSCFLKGEIYRESCYDCKYAGGGRQGDFTMGDYWGIEKSHPEIDIKNGISVLLVNSAKGIKLIEKLEKHLTLVHSTFEQARVHNEQLRQPTKRSEKRAAILKIWREGGYQAIADRYYRLNRRKMISYRIKKLIPPRVKELVKLIMIKESLDKR